MENSVIENVYRFNGSIYETKEDAELAERYETIKQKLMSVLNVSYDTSFEEFWNAYIRNEKAIELTNSIEV